MTRVRSLSNHPYGGSMRLRGSEYDVESSEDLALLLQLKRVERADTTSTSGTYRTRELQAAKPEETAAPIMTTRGDLRGSRAVPRAETKPIDKP